MQRRLILTSVTLLASFSSLGLAAIVARAQSTALTISVAASLQDAINALQPLYEEKNPDVELVINFGSSGSLQQQIEQGAPVDVFLSASARQMDALEEKDLLLPGSRTDLVKNQLVLITPVNGLEIKSPADLMQPEIKRIALGEPASVPAGTYGQQALTVLDLVEALEPRFVFGKDVRQVLNYVETGNMEAGIVYRTDALLSQQVQIALTFPAETHDPIVYPIAVINDSKYPTEAQHFVKFLQTDGAQAVFTQFGFQFPG
ncbi:MAG: molybdate ABC transporter substrate-binding protein [Synechococcaceae cyanobacterium SM2_3_1]|nr:molybdate ABC transporter substrate-binding protein [Synechococcaceae cyanobacterium SM2_3_1]